LRFREAVRRTIRALQRHPYVGAHYRSANPKLPNLRSWPVTGFEAIRAYYTVEDEMIQVIRILHGKRDVRHILENEEDL
jgi:toxin ParE1/3/4